MSTICGLADRIVVPTKHSSSRMLSRNKNVTFLSMERIHLLATYHTSFPVTLTFFCSLQFLLACDMNWIDSWNLSKQLWGWLGLATAVDELVDCSGLMQECVNNLNTPGLKWNFQKIGLTTYTFSVEQDINCRFKGSKPKIMFAIERPLTVPEVITPPVPVPLPLPEI